MSNGALVLGIAVLAIGGYVYYVRTQKHKALVEFTKANCETIDGELKLEDVVAYFKLQNLKYYQVYSNVPSYCILDQRNLTDS